MKPFIPLLLVLSLAACAPISPEKHQVSALSGEQLALSPDETAMQWPDDHWWERYQDPQLNQLILQALENNPSLQAATARVRTAQAAAQGARAVQWPQINANYHLTRERLSEHYIYPPPLGGSTQSDTGLTLQLDFNPDLWGKQAALSHAAQSRAAAAQASSLQARTLLISTVAQAYFQLQNAQAQTAAIEAIVGKLQEALAITQDRYRNGLGIQVDVDQADSAVSSAQVQLSQVRNNVNLMHHQLAALLGISPSQLPRPALIPHQTIPTGVPAQMPMALLGRRADITAARLQAQAAGAEISAAQADFLPNINLSASLGFLSLGIDQLFRSGSFNATAGPVITLPIFNAGALNAQLAGRRSVRDEAIAQYNETVLNAIREVADASTSITALQTQIQYQASSLRAIASAYDVGLQRYKAGLGNFVQVLMAQNEVLKQTVQATDLQTRAYLLDVQLASALGGGYREPDAMPAPTATPDLSLQPLTDSSTPS
ncbi:efflux transporter outer membrane subunit [Castellaniella sp.]|uniref:efflux transporter outer membrane subunit n=1 Tax=Castellaniella sp. TaxID=1955812 RepID=UPI002AFDFB48|nr:efflux transporter outer membrane subunit [Castellaniella sp.]